MTRTLPFLLILSLAGVVAGCEEEAPESTESDAPILGLMEFPISHRVAPAPSGAARIEVSPTLLRLDGATVLELERGRPAEDAVQGDQLPALASAIAAAPARRIAELNLHGNTPYRTTALILSTLKAANIGQLAFAVRTPGEPQPGFLLIDSFELREESQERFAFSDQHMPDWDAFAEGWSSMYTACRENHYVDCAFKPSNIAEGGKAHLTLFVRGNAIKLELHRIADEEEEEAPAGGGVAMIDGVPSPEPAEDEEMGPPADHGAFTWRFNASTDAESPVSGTMRPLCGARSCGVLVTSEGQTQTMRIVSFLGALFPTGTEAPHVVFEVPSR